MLSLTARHRSVNIRSLPAGCLLHHCWLRQCLLLKLLNQLFHVDLEQRYRVLQGQDGVTVRHSGEGRNLAAVGQISKGIRHERTGPLRLGHGVKRSCLPLLRPQSRG